ncbi:CCA tRNA nucleotidyltransferase [Salipaludibacillus aurantiacus]|uniref:tRNA nucleotidyltransferase (CCA-adding enzyme) n=1 Tax=Salipaludibacillus aurantiacus TaxID=1601833 RepID=A0A1H9P5K3_9BACI|nr:CCA tRNA nucleotidyltransferase [Salipaludibacillus aurantiacus]SER43574.1 tRNA nucleotidyltransferase (CCA-adding enzyme) [Salipaludibacillus aurantiacus]
MTWEEAGKYVLSVLTEAGFESYIVGGAVRDEYLSNPVHDVDISTEAETGDIQSVFPRTIDVGIQHGTVLVPVKGKPVEVSTFKGKSIKEDLRNRDFTCNSMAKTLQGEIIDPFGGKEDIDTKRLRTIGNSRAPFLEDPLRLLRALRFALQLGFKIDKETQDHMDDLAELILKPAAERIASETEKMSQTNLSGIDWDWLLKQRVFQQLPFVFKNAEVQSSLRTLKKPLFINDLLTWWSVALYNNAPESAKAGLSYYKRSNRLTKDVITIHSKVHQFFSDGWSLYDIYVLGEQRLDIAILLVKLVKPGTITADKWHEVYNDLPVKNKSDLPVTGRDLIAQFPALSGWEIGRWLKSIEKAVVEGAVANEKKAVLAWAEKEFNR